MPNPKRRHSSSRRDKRRTHIKLALPTLSTCPVTGEVHLRHHAYWHEDKMYYNGKVVMVREQKASADAASESNEEGKQ
jgi:large subunit ribosomal protein L32